MKTAIKSDLAASSRYSKSLMQPGAQGNPITTKYTSALTRRTFLASSGGAAIAALLGPRHLFAHEASGGSDVPLAGLVARARKAAETARITVEKLRGNVSVLIGSGGNIAVLHGKDGKLLVDTGLTGSRPQITEALAGLSAAPVRHVVDTHWHFDYTDGNEWLHDAGATIIAHENVRKRMSETTRVDPWDFTSPPSPAAALPAVTLRMASEKDGTAGTTFYLNGTSVRLVPYQP
jgi:Metallo-beta-lactamase superfamily